MGHTHKALTNWQLSLPIGASLGWPLKCQPDSGVATAPETEADTETEIALEAGLVAECVKA